MKALERVIHEVKNAYDVFELFKLGRISEGDIINFPFIKELVTDVFGGLRTPDSIEGVYTISQGISCICRTRYNRTGGTHLGRYEQRGHFEVHKLIPDKGEFERYKKMIQEAGIWKEKKNEIRQEKTASC